MSEIVSLLLFIQQPDIVYERDKHGHHKFGEWDKLPLNL